MLKWEQALGEEFSTEQWRTIWSQTAKSSICILYKEDMYKVLFFWYMTAAHLDGIYPSASDRCWRCRRTFIGNIHFCHCIGARFLSCSDLIQQLFDLDKPQ